MSRIVAILLALATLVPTSAFASALYRCRASGEVRRSCCCERDEAARATAQGDGQVRSAPCCDVIRSQGHERPAQVETIIQLLVGARARQPVLLVAPIRVAMRVEAPRPPPPTTCPRFVLHCAFLI